VGWGGGEMLGYSLMSIEFQSYKIKRVIEMIGGDGYTIL
jgi:hypothetical protein